MKLAALAPRTISFQQETAVQQIRARAPLHSAAACPVREYREARGPHLTPRELEVLALLCEGLPNKLISRRLNISTGTVKIHVGKILSQLGVASRLQAVVAAHRQGLVSESEAPAEQQDEAQSIDQSLAFTRRSPQVRALRAA